MCMGLLCVDFAVGILVFDVKFVGMDCKYYTYVLVRGGYESVGIGIKQKLREDIHSLISVNQTEWISVFRKLLRIFFG